MATLAIRPALTGIWLPARTVNHRVRTWNGTPEIFFSKEIDNSRLVKVADRRRNREMAMLGAALSVFFLLVMIYAWQHFSAVEYGYRIEALQAQHDQLLEANRALSLEQASLADPERIDALARQMGLATPSPDQVVQLDPGSGDPGSPVIARATEVAVVAGVE